MMLMGPDGGRTPVGEEGEGSASPVGSAATDDITPTPQPPPSPCLNEIGDDDATPRQQWSPVYTVGGGRSGGANPNNRGYHRGAYGGGGGTFTTAGCSGEQQQRALSARSTTSTIGDNNNSSNCCSQSSIKGGGGGCAGTFSHNNFQGVHHPPPQQQALHQRPRLAPSRPDSPVLRVDLERLDLSVLALGEEGGPAVPHHGPGSSSAGGACSSGSNRNSRGELVLHPASGDTFRSEHGPMVQGVRPRSLGGRPSRTHALFVAPGQLGTGPASPPSSYSTHSESGGFASPTTRLTSPFGQQFVGGGGAGSSSSGSGAGAGREYYFHHHHQQQQPHYHHHHTHGRVKKGHWKKGKPIGVGSCGDVYLGMNEDTGELMAVKEITLETKDRLLTSLYNEIQVRLLLLYMYKNVCIILGIIYSLRFVPLVRSKWYFLYMHEYERRDVCLGSLLLLLCVVCGQFELPYRVYEYHIILCLSSAAEHRMSKRVAQQSCGRVGG